MLGRRLLGGTGAVLLLSAMFGPNVAWAQAAGQWKDAAQIYERICAYCHEANVGPKLLGRRMTEEYVGHIVQSGLRAMPAFRPTDLNAAEVAALGKFINQSKAGDGKGEVP
jgi:mono/diheme cytochrome c family protein